MLSRMGLKKLSIKTMMMLIPAKLSSNSDPIPSSPHSASGPPLYPPEVIITRPAVTSISHIDYINDTREPRGAIIDIRMRSQMIEIPVTEPPKFLLKFQKTIDVSIQ